MALKIMKIVLISWVRAKVIALPKKGAEQGVASITANIPDKKLGMKILWVCSSFEIFLFSKLVSVWLKENSKTPSRLQVKKVRTKKMKIKKYVF